MGSIALCIFYSSLVASLWSGNSGWSLPSQIPLLPGPSPSDLELPQRPEEQTFTLRHVYHRGIEYPDLHRRVDIHPEEIEHATLEKDEYRRGIGPFRTSSAPISMHRLRKRRIEDIAAYNRIAESAERQYAAWVMEDVAAPQIRNKSTVVDLSIMAANAYDATREDKEWEDVGRPFNLSASFGWQQDGLRGHVFADETNSTIVVSIKGTSRAIWDGEGTTAKDKLNDNLLAGCCCGQGAWTIPTAWNCKSGIYSCNDNCVEKEMRRPDRYYQASIELYGNITEQYPNANVWLVGHSLGGLVSSLLGLTFGHPVVTFEAIPQALAASRLRLPTPPGNPSALEARNNAAIWNFGHTADPIYMGTCNGATSLCYMAGYSLESQCHSGLRCVYDVVGDKGWWVSMSTHPIRSSIRDVYKAYDDVPVCVSDTECVDCFNWNLERKNYSTSTATASSSTTKTRTRIATCRTPGWWGCRDATSTSWSSTSTSTTTITTTSCESYGWFGKCLNSTTAILTSETTIYAATATTYEAFPTVTTTQDVRTDLKTSPSSQSQITAQP